MNTQEKYFSKEAGEVQAVEQGVSAISKNNQQAKTGLKPAPMDLDRFKEAGPVQERVGSTEPVQQELNKNSPKTSSSKTENGAFFFTLSFFLLHSNSK
jgi:hypothetical protein